MMELKGYFLLPIIVVLLLVASHHTSRAGTYEDASNLLDDLITKANYKPQIRPLWNQNETLYVFLIFELLSIVEVNDVFQSFSCNGFMGFFWVDQMLIWNTTQYNGEYLITPQSSDIFRPRIALLNTMGERDLFGKDTAPVTVRPNGLVSWIPGSIFPVSCQLDLTKYPFDEQICTMEMIAMDYPPNMLTFISSEDAAGQHFYIENGEWEVTANNISTEILMVTGDPISAIEVSFAIKRKPGFLVMSVLLPIVFLSLLNLLVFVIPVESGEKISFGITVLLALAVFMSIISGMLPRSAESMPLMIRYIFCLLIISVLTVVDSIVIVRLHHMEEKGEQPVSTEEPKQFSSLLPRVMTHTPGTTLSPLGHLRLQEEERESRSGSGSGSMSTSSGVQKDNGKVKVNKYKLVGKHTDLISLVLFGIVWVAVTVEFLVSAGARV